MRNVRDTFLHFLADNLDLDVHAVRADTSNPKADEIRMEAVNVSFTTLNIDTVSEQYAVIDVMGWNELTVVGWIDQIQALLRAAYMTPMLSYANPASPVPVGGNIYWDRGDVRFTRVISRHYAHYTCALALRFSVQ